MAKDYGSYAYNLTEEMVRAEPSAIYNCHAYTFGYTSLWLTHPAGTILANETCTVVNAMYEADKTIHTNITLAHSNKVTTISECGFIRHRVTGKYGSHAVYETTVMHTNIVYNTQGTYYLKDN